MIGVVLSGQRFAPLVRYLLHYSDDAPQAVILDTNLAAPDRYPLDHGDRLLARETAAELQRLAGRRPDVRDGVLHASLRLVPGESRRPEQWIAMARDWLAELGYRDTGYLVVQHTPQHVHIAASRIRFDGSRVKDHQEWRRNRAACDHLEERYDLEPAREHFRPGRDFRVGRREYRLAETLDEVPTRAMLHDRVMAALAQARDMEGYSRALEALGVRAHWNVSPSTGRVHGASYELLDYQGQQARVWKGSQVGVPQRDLARYFEARQRQPAPERERPAPERWREAPERPGR